MRALLDLYVTSFTTMLAVQLQYRVAMVIWQIGTVLEPVVYLVVWATVARASGGQVGGYGVADFAAYYIVLMLVNHATFTWIMYEMEYRVRQGAFSPLLLKPVHPIHRDVADNVAHKILALAVLAPATLGLALAFRPTWRPEPWALALFVPSLLLAGALRFLVEWTLALATFWTTRVAAVNQLYFVVLLFFSGQMAPLALFPAPVRALAAVLPFRWMVAFPVELFLGRTPAGAAALGLAAQMAWLALASLGFALVWRAGTRRYAAVGT